MRCCAGSSIGLLQRQAPRGGGGPRHSPLDQGDLGLNIREAHVFNTTDGFALDVFVVDGWSSEQQQQPGSSLEEQLGQRLLRMPPPATMPGFAGGEQRALAALAPACLPRACSRTPPAPVPRRATRVVDAHSRVQTGAAAVQGARARRRRCSQLPSGFPRSRSPCSKT
jgi:hypothetical protein